MAPKGGLTGAASLDLPTQDVAGTLAWLRRHPSLRAPVRAPQGSVSTGLGSLDAALAGGFPAGAMTELVAGDRGAAPTAGRTALALAAVSAATRRGELVGWVDTEDCLDPRSLAAAGAALDNVLWVRPRGRDARKQALAAADLVVKAGGFGLLVLDLVGSTARGVPDATWVRLAHHLKGQRTALVVLTAQTLVGTQAHVRLACRYRRGGEVDVTVVKRRGGQPGDGARVRLGAPVE